MSQQENLRIRIRAIKPLEAKFKLSLSSDSGFRIHSTTGRVKDEPGDDPLDTLVQNGLNESFDRAALKHVIRVENTFNNCIFIIHAELLKAIELYSEAVKPKLTNLYKKIDRLGHNEKARESFIPLWVYYRNNSTDIETDSKSKHRQNILVLLEKIAETH